MSQGKKTSVKQNYLMSILLTLSNLLYGVVSFFYVSRVLQPEGIGKAAFASSVVSYFLLLSQLGIPTYGIRLCSTIREDKEKLSKAVHEILVIQFFMCLVTYLLFFLTIFTVPRFFGDKLLFTISSLSIFLNAIGADWLYKALEKYTYLTVCSVIFRLIALAGIFLYVKQGQDYAVYAGFTVLAGSGYLIINFISLRKYISLKRQKNYDFRQHKKPIIVFFAMSCAITIYTNLDTAMLGFFRSDAETGVYSAAIQLKSILVSVICSLGTVMLPRVSEYIEQGRYKEFQHMAEKAIHFMILIATPIVVFFTLFAKAGIILLSGDFFEAAIVPMQIIMPTVLFIGLTNIMGIQMLVPLGKEKKVLYSVASGAVVNIIINAQLIPGYGASGAAIGTLAAEFTVWVVQMIFLWDMVSPIYRKIHYVPILLGAGLGGLLGFWFQTLDYDGIYYYIKIAIAAVLYFLIYFAVLRLFRNELVMEGLEDIKKRRKDNKNGRTCN